MKTQQIFVVGFEPNFFEFFKYFDFSYLQLINFNLT